MSETPLPDRMMQELRRMDKELEKTQCERADARRELKSQRKETVAFLTDLIVQLDGLEVYSGNVPEYDTIIASIKQQIVSLQGKIESMGDQRYDSLAELVHDPVGE